MMDKTATHSPTRSLLMSAAMIGAFSLIGAGPLGAQQTFQACYVPDVGAIYLIGFSGLPTSCLSASHVPISWTDGGGGVTDHGALSGLGDDDHSIYLLANGVRNPTNGFAVRGTHGEGSIPVQGAGPRLMWYPAKSAFRAGSDAGGSWDDANIGEYSSAIGAGTTASGQYSTAMGGLSEAKGEGSTAMGYQAIAEGDYSTAMGGNTLARGRYSTAMGFLTTATGDFSVAMGMRASTNGYRGSFVFADYTNRNDVLLAPSLNTFTVRARGGYRLYTSGDLSAGVRVRSGGSSWSSVSDRNMKENFQDEDGERLLRAIASMPIQTWNYKAQDPSIRHMGPMAQDFYAAFGLGHDDKHINTVDIDGVNMMAAQALEKRTRDLQAENRELRARVEELETALFRIRTFVTGGEG